MSQEWTYGGRMVGSSHLMFLKKKNKPKRTKKKEER
jgi:hypothetical protein